MSTPVSSCSGWSVRRIHQPGRADGANVIVRRSRPRNVPTPATLASAARVVRFAGQPRQPSGARRTSSTACALNRASAASSEACEPRTRRQGG